MATVIITADKTFNIRVALSITLFSCLYNREPVILPTVVSEAMMEPTESDQDSCRLCGRPKRPIRMLLLSMEIRLSLVEKVRGVNDLSQDVRRAIIGLTY